MGCFQELRIPWMQGSDLGDPDVGGEHLAENFRFIDKWANPLTNNCAAVTDAARAASTPFSGTIAAAGTHTLKGADGGTVSVAGDMLWDGTTGTLTLPRAGFYVGSMQVTIGNDGLVDPYWIQLGAPTGEFKQIPPFAAAGNPLLVTTSLFYIPADNSTTSIKIFNNATATDSIDFSAARFFLCEIGGSV